MLNPLTLLSPAPPHPKMIALELVDIACVFVLAENKAVTKGSQTSKIT